MGAPFAAAGGSVPGAVPAPHKTIPPPALRHSVPATGSAANAESHLRSPRMSAGA